MALTAEDVASLARLARIELKEAELEVLAPKLRDLGIVGLGYPKSLRKTSRPLSHALPLTNAFRDDEPGPCLPREQVSALAASSRSRCDSGFRGSLGEEE